MMRMCHGCGVIGEIPSMTKGRCPSCTRAEYRRQNNARPPGEREFYSSSAWQRLRAQVMAEEDACAWCGASDVKLTAGHVETLRRRPDLALERDNVHASCRSCQVRVQRRTPS